MDELTEATVDRVLEVLEDLFDDHRQIDYILSQLEDESKPEDVKRIVKRVIRLVENEFDF